MKILIVFLTVCLGMLQYKLWLGDGSRRELKEVEKEVASAEGYVLCGCHAVLFFFGDL